MIHPSRRAQLALAAIALSALSGHAGHCGDEEEPLRSPVHAIAWVLEDESGHLEARLVAFSTTRGTPQLVPLAELALVVGEEVVFLEHDTPTEIPFAYDPTVPFVFELTVGEPAATEHLVTAGRFDLAMHGPTDRPHVWWSLDPSEEGAELAWHPAGMPLYVEVRDASGAIAWSNLEAPRPEKSWSLPKGTLSLPPEAFPEGADHLLACGADLAKKPPGTPAPSPQHLAHATLTPSLGWLSGIIVARCRTLPID